MALEKAPAFQFYPKDFLMDGNVSGMSLQERGAYITLLCICWLEGSLPADVGRLANIVGTPRKTFAKFWPAIAVCFQEHGDRLMHGRLEIEREKQAEYRRRQSDAGNASAARRQPKPQPHGNHGATTVQPDPQPDPQPKGNSPSPISSLRSPSPKEHTHTRERDDEAFVTFTAAYPASRRQGGYMVEHAFVEALGAVGLPTLIAAVEQHKRSEQWAVANKIPNMLTWLQDKRWIQTLAEPSAFGSSGKTAGNVAALQRFAGKS